MLQLVFKFQDFFWVLENFSIVYCHINLYSINIKISAFFISHQYITHIIKRPVFDLFFFFLQFLDEFSNFNKSYKGGTGKSTIASNYAYNLAQLGFEVLAIDLDPQGHLTRSLGIPDEASRTLPTIMDGITKGDISTSIISIKDNLLHLIPSNVNLTIFEKYLQQQSIAVETKLYKLLQPIMPKYNYIIIDCAPSVSLANINAMVAADDIIVPIIPDFLSYDGLNLLFKDISALRENATMYHARQIRIIVNKYDQRLSIADILIKTLKEEYKDMLLNSIIRQDATVERAQAKLLTIFEYAKRSKFAQDIISFTHEMLENEKKFTLNTVGAKND